MNQPKLLQCQESRLTCTFGAAQLQVDGHRLLPSCSKLLTAASWSPEEPSLDGGLSARIRQAEHQSSGNQVRTMTPGIVDKSNKSCTWQNNTSDTKEGHLGETCTTAVENDADDVDPQLMDVFKASCRPCQKPLGQTLAHYDKDSDVHPSQEPRTAQFLFESCLQPASSPFHMMPQTSR